MCSGKFIGFPSPRPLPVRILLHHLLVLLELVVDFAAQLPSVRVQPVFFDLTLTLGAHFFPLLPGFFRFILGKISIALDMNLRFRIVEWPILNPAIWVSLRRIHLSSLVLSFRSRAMSRDLGD